MKTQKNKHEETLNLMNDESTFEKISKMTDEEIEQDHIL